MNTFSILNPLNEEQEVPSSGYLLVTVSRFQQIGSQNLLNHSNTGGFISSRIPERVVLKSEKREIIPVLSWVFTLLTCILKPDRIYMSE